MSTNLNYKQVANVERRTWDVEVYEKKAQQRLEDEEKEPQHDERATKAISGSKEEFRPAEVGAAGPEGSNRAFLKARKGVVDIDSRVGKIEMVSVEAATNTSKPSDGVVKTGVGWHCKVCDCFLKDSHTYLDHINGRKHQRKLGYSMRVERSSKDSLVAKLQSLDQKKADDLLEQELEENFFQNMVKSKDEELEKRRLERKLRRKERKMAAHGETKNDESSSVDVAQLQNSNFEEDDNALKQGQKEKGEESNDDDDNVKEEEEEQSGIDPNLAAIMGFSGFSSSSKS